MSAAPLAVWDPNDSDGLFRRNWQEASAWAIEHLPRASDTFFAAFYLIDAPFAVVRRMKRNEDGKHYNDPETGEPAAEELATVMLAELPPPHLLGRAGNDGPR